MNIFIGRGRWQSGQMAVELAVVMPVLLVVAVIVFDALSFAGECARFDHIAAQAVLAQGASADRESYAVEARAGKIKEQIKNDMGAVASNVEVTAQSDSDVALWNTCTFTCVFEMAPWPFQSADFHIAGVRIPTKLTHEYALTVEPYTPGKLL